MRSTLLLSGRFISEERRGGDRDSGCGFLDLSSSLRLSMVNTSLPGKRGLRLSRRRGEWMRLSSR
ncbi:hypothetical protein GH141_07320 [bacterium]|nr:hypothetical protein [bacterium]